MPDPAQTPWQRWNAQLEAARKVRGYKTWVAQGQKIIKRYRDQRTDNAEYTDSINSADQSRFNILWSNVQTLMPATFAKPPKPVVERRYLDRDEVGRTASMILERALLYEIDTGTYYEALRRAVLDRLLPGRGVVWVRYEPTFRNIQTKVQQDPDAAPDDEPDEDEDDDDAGEGGDSQDSAEGQEAEPANAEDDPAGGEGGKGADGKDGADADESDEEKIYESAPVDYIDWEDFLTSPSRTWEEVWWLAKRVYLTRDELIARFGDKAADIKLDWSPAESKENSPSTTPGDTGSKAKIWEIWNKRERKVYWHTEGDNSFENGDELDCKDDPLKLECFWPVPKPLCSTITNDSMIPVSDYHEYQDQAGELDELTGRISALTRAIKVAGVYDASIPELQRIFQEGKENELVGVDNMAEFATKAGPDGMGHIWLLPIKDMAATLLQLYQARDQVKQVLYELTGISDIVRGQASEGGAKTATEQRIKGQFASLRLNDVRSDVARFARDVLRIMGEIIAEHYSDKMLFLVSSYEQYAREQFLDTAPTMPPPGMPPGAPGMGPSGMPPPGMPPGPPMGPPQGQPIGLPPPQPAPLGGMAGAGAGMPPQGSAPAPLPPLPPAMAGLGNIPPLAPLIAAAPPPSPAQKAAEMFAKALELLRNDKLRGFRVDIETDSLIEADEQATQQARTELLGAISQFLPQAMQAGMMDPKLKPLLGQLLLFFLRGFKAGRDIEGMFEQFIDDMQKEAKNPQPKPPSPEQIKANAEMQKQQAESQRQQQQAVLDQQSAQQEQALQQQKAQIEIERERAKLEIERERLKLEQEKTAMKLFAEQHKHSLDADARARDAAIDEQSAIRQDNMAQAAAGRETEAATRDHELSMAAMEAKANGTGAEGAE